ncbi:MAG: hypothetical protein R3C09_14625 [Pirellulaceae bacterium]
MTKRQDSEKLIAWRQRLAKLSASGLSVTAFCRQAGITPAKFYYWSRRVREAGSAVDRKQPDASTRVGRQSIEIANTVEVAIGEHVKIRLPSNDHDLLGAVLARLQSSAAAAKPAGAFERIELSHFSTASR